MSPKEIVWNKVNQTKTINEKFVDKKTNCVNLSLMTFLHTYAYKYYTTFSSYEIKYEKRGILSEYRGVIEDT